MCPHSFDFVPKGHEEPVKVRCRKCAVCRSDKQRELIARFRYDIADMYKAGRSTAFVTYTYSDQWLPKDGSLHKEHIQAAKHRLQDMTKRRYGSPCKYIISGEYGDTLGRPHYHAVFAGLDDFKDADIISHCWPYGMIKILPLLAGGIKYVLKYMDKQLFGDAAKEVYGDLQVPFHLQSTGIGYSALDEQRELIRSTGKFLTGKNVIPAPEYYKRIVGNWNIPKDLDYLKFCKKNADLQHMTVEDYQQMRSQARESALISELRLSGSASYQPIRGASHRSAVSRIVGQLLETDLTK